MSAQHIKRFFAVSGTDRIALVSLGLRVPVYRLALKALGYERFHIRFITSCLSTKTPPSIDQAKHQGQLVNMAVSAIAGRDNCLLRSVMLSRRLAKQGLATKIIFGVGKEEAAFQAHSWVEVEGVVINDREDIAQMHAVFETPNK